MIADRILTDFDGMRRNLNDFDEMRRNLNGFDGMRRNLNGVGCESKKKKKVVPRIRLLCAHANNSQIFKCHALFKVVCSRICAF